ncbi:cation:H+ antiporter [Hathewaya proteolytica DSM 3090]|uniref:Cation:H+ antiporter n=1 Tax=Hathewaya proteolytica DSM 3090 TaxID=1121331 RepID=A0A1M6QUF4_9CLOT|nr:calcium/sodium antiporter [Hathewaya proteolytica]SHK23912.1 cation:H+ antiporter [Hathewaya proteolytica DSM 3090]
MDYILLIVGFFFLIKGADLFVDGSSAVAKKIGIPAVIVGLTIVSIGTSAPELAVSTISAIEGNNGIALGNVIGSNIFNTLVVLGATAVFSPLFIKKDSVKKDFLVCIVASVLLFILSFNKYFGGKDNVISRLDGMILVGLCILYISYLIYITKKNKNNMDICEEEKKSIEKIKTMPKILLGIVGIIGIVVGGEFVVDSASNIARSLGMSDKLVGLTIVAMGTSLPELVTSIMAVLKGENEIALGNVLGSNIFNIFLILGVSSCITPIAVPSVLAVDLLILISITILLGLIIFVFSRDKVKKLVRIEGVMLIFIYIAYTFYIIIRK